MSTGNDVPKDKMKEFLERDNIKYEHALINERRINKGLLAERDTYSREWDESSKQARNLAEKLEKSEASRDEMILEELPKLKEKLLESQAREIRLRVALGRIEADSSVAGYDLGYPKVNEVAKEALNDPAPPIADSLDKAIKSMEKYGIHKEECWIFDLGQTRKNIKCTCGFTEALAELQYLRGKS